MSTQDKAENTENKPNFVRFGQPLPEEIETFLRFSNPWWEVVGRRSIPFAATISPLDV